MNAPAAVAGGNIARALGDRARENPERIAVIVPGRKRGCEARWTFRELEERSNALALGLLSAGIPPGARAVLMVRPGLELFGLVFALFKARIIPVVADPGLGLRSLRRCLAEARPQAFIGDPLAQAARFLLGWGRKTIETVVTTGPVRLGTGLTLGEAARKGASSGRSLASEARPEDPAAILFTSGSTGPPKGAVYTHGNFAAQIRALRETYAIEPGEVDLCTFPLFALFAPALGMTAVVPDMDPARPARADPRRIIGAIEAFGVTNLFGSPALIDPVGRHGAAQGIHLGTLRRVVSAGAPVPARAVERFARLLPPGAQVFTPYGATEALPVASIASDEILGETRALTDAGRGVCVGRPVRGVEVDVIRVSDEPIERWSEDLRVPRGEVGEFAVRGAAVTREYFGRPEATRLAKVPAGGGQFLHRMGDLGYLDEKGRLWFCGRKSQRVQTASGVLHTICCEAVFNTHPRVRRTALVGVGREPSGESSVKEPVLCVELEGPLRRGEKETLRREILALGAAREPTRSIRTLLYHPRFPVDVRHNSKIGREALAAWARRRLP